MNHRDLALAAMRGQAVDHIPFIGRMDLWYTFHRNGGTLPSPYENAGLWDIQRDMGIGIFGFGAWDISFYGLIHQKVEITQEIHKGLTTIQYHTPFGTLTCCEEMPDELQGAAGAGARVEFPFKTADDYDALAYLIEHTEVVENFQAYDEFVDAIGTDGVALPFAGWLPAHQLMIRYMGYETFYYQLHDHPHRIESAVRFQIRQNLIPILRRLPKCYPLELPSRLLPVLDRQIVVSLSGPCGKDGFDGTTAVLFRMVSPEVPERDQEIGEAAHELLAVVPVLRRDSDSLS